MRAHFQIEIILFAFTFHVFAGNAAAQSKAAAALQKQRASLARESDPVSRTKIDIAISDLLITLLSDAARSGNDDLVAQYLTDYATTIQDAHQTMIGTGKDAHKHPNGFKDLEIALRKQQRQIVDAGKLMSYNQRIEVDKVRKLIADLDDQLVKAMLLKEPNAPRKR